MVNSVWGDSGKPHTYVVEGAAYNILGESFAVSVEEVNKYG